MHTYDMHIYREELIIVVKNVKKKHLTIYIYSMIDNIFQFKAFL